MTRGAEARKAAAVTPEGLWAAFEAKVRERFGEDWEFSGEDFLKLDRVSEDIGVEFSFENCAYTADRESGPLSGMLGPLSLGGLPFIGACSGGDWEHPVYFVVYLDANGTTLRAYVPRDGNPWNYDTHQALGNDEQADLRLLKKLFPCDPGIQAANACDAADGELLWDRDRMYRDIREHVVA